MQLLQQGAVSELCQPSSRARNVDGAAQKAQSFGDVAAVLTEAGAASVPVLPGPGLCEGFLEWLFYQSLHLAYYSRPDRQSAGRGLGVGGPSRVALAGN